MRKINLPIDLSIVIPAANEGENLHSLLPEIIDVLKEMPITYEIIVIDELADDFTKRVVERSNAVLISDNSPGYGNSLIEGIRASRGRYILTMDADFSHPPHFIKELWKRKISGDVVIASRYIEGGKAIMPISRYILSRILNIFFSRGLDLHVKDMSSGFRLYRSDVIKNQSPQCINFDIVQELLVRTLIEGYKISEIPFVYQPRKFGSSHARVIKFGLDYLRTFTKLWKIRNSIASADYDARAFDTFLIPQRVWQRKRFRFVTSKIKKNSRCLDVGCGTSKILNALPVGSVGLDILFRKLRYSRAYNKPLIHGSALSLPFKNESFECVICSQVIEHIAGSSVLSELDRILKPNGRLILGTPDYGKWQWKLIEWLYKHILPQAYADEHITHYTLGGLLEEYIEKLGYSIDDINYIYQGELILSLNKPSRMPCVEHTKHCNPR